MFNQITRGVLTLFLARAGEVAPVAPKTRPASPDSYVVLHG